MAKSFDLLLLATLLACRPSLADRPAGADLQRLTATAELDALVEGEVAVIDLWATWCEPCRESIPKIVRLADAYDDLVVVGIHVGEGVEGAERFAVEANIHYPLYSDPEFAFSDRIGSRSVPTLLVVDQAGRIVRRGTELDASTLALVRTLLSAE
jgi:cytochrome c biogenesis protein CcmG/thiol:disulfide interchange protein DsbE